MLALRLASPPATAVLAPRILASVERVPHPRQRLALLANVFFLLLVRPSRGGRAPGGRGGSGDGSSRRRESRESGGSSRPSALEEGAKMLVSVIEGEWFGTLVSDSPGGGGTRRLLFREEAVAALATTCAQVG